MDSIVGWVSVAAILISPLIAVLITKWLQDREKYRNDKMNIFKTLVANRSIIVNMDKVNALNMIDVIFSKNSIIRQLWKDYHDIVHAKNYDEELREKKYQELINAMGQDLGYGKEINSLDFARSYVPRGITDPMNKNAELVDEFIKALRKYNA